MSDQLSTYVALTGNLQTLLVRLGIGNLRQGSLQRLTGGASKEMWSFDAVGPAGAVPLIMRRFSADAVPSDSVINPETEAFLIRRAGECAVPTPGIRHILEPGDDLGRGFLSDRIEGETLARRILRNPEFAEIRTELAFECGAILARIHAVPREDLPPLKTRFAAGQLYELYESYQSFGGGSAVFEAAFRWLREHMPADAETPRLVHGDFRNGNLIIGGARRHRLGVRPSRRPGRGFGLDHGQQLALRRDRQAGRRLRQRRGHAGGLSLRRRRSDRRGDGALLAHARHAALGADLPLHGAAGAVLG